MPRNGKCTRCLYMAPLTSFMEAAGDGRLVPVFGQLPNEVQVYFLSYMSLFRPKSGSAVQLPKVMRLTQELVDLVKLQYVHVQGQVDRPCTPGNWAMGMEQMIEQAQRLTLPIKNHNYLKSIVWDVANKADSKQESQKRKAPLHKQTRSGYDADPGLDPLEKARREWDAKHGNDEVNVDLKDVSSCVKGME